MLWYWGISCSGNASLKQANSEEERDRIKQKQLYGIELQPYMFTIATANMILRSNGESNLINDDFLSLDPDKLQLRQYTVGMINPPYSQGSKRNPDLYEISFVEHMLDSLNVGARGIAIVPQSTMTGKTKEEKDIKENILKKHTLEGVITLNRHTFYGVGTLTCIAIFTAGEPHPNDKESKFIKFEDDGYKASPHIGLIETEQAIYKKQKLLDVWFDRVESEMKFCVKTQVEPSDEWLHSFYYFNDDIPAKEDFEKAIGAYLTFEFSMIMQNKSYLFEKSEILRTVRESSSGELLDPSYKEWDSFLVKDLYTIRRGNAGKVSNYIQTGDIALVTAIDKNNGVYGYTQPTGKEKVYENMLTIHNNGNGVGLCFYHEYKFIASSDVSVLIPKIDIPSLSSRFIALSLMKQRNKYNYGYKLSNERLEKQRILLPVKNNGLPDYDYMEQHIKNIIINKYNQYLYYLQN